MLLKSLNSTILLNQPSYMYVELRQQQRTELSSFFFVVFKNEIFLYNSEQSGGNGSKHSERSLSLKRTHH